MTDVVVTTKAPGAPNALAGLKALRRKRQRNRLADMEWFDAAYKVYIVAIFGGGGVLWISSGIGDQPVSASAAADIARNGPAVLGLLAVFAVMTGLRSGAQGGPLALEGADVVHVMLAPVDRLRALMKPTWQRVRSASASASVTGAIAGQLAGRRLPGSAAAWAGGGALFGLTVALLWVGAALVAHAVRLRLWIATLTGLGLLGWQAASVARHLHGPANTVGSLALWGWRQHPVDLIGLGLGLGLTIAGAAMLRRTSLDALARRSSLVAQLRFAVTMQDLRTVILLRRQLNQERTRNRPWFRVPRRGKHIVWRRGWHSIARLPATRVVRMTAIAAVAGIMAGVVARGTTSALLLLGLALFLLGLEVLEPLSQEVDQPDRADSLPVVRAELMMLHLAAPAAALLPFAVVAGIAGALTIGTSSAIAPVAIMTLPVVLAGACGAVVSIVRDMPDPFSAQNQQAFIPPEMAGFTTVLRTLLPIVVSTLGVCTVLIARAAYRNGDSLAGGAARGAIGSILVVSATAAWVRMRDQIKAKFRNMMNESREYTSQKRTF